MRFIIKQIPHVLEVYEVEGGGLRFHPRGEEPPSSSSYYFARGLALYKYFRFSMSFIIKQIPHVLEVFEVEGGGLRFHPRGEEPPSSSSSSYYFARGLALYKHFS
jgi:hypothetical protein